MNAFTNGVTSAGTVDRALTANGGITLSTSGSTLVDLFFLAGASRGKDITTSLARSFGDEKELTLRLILWTRDVRGGAGERQTFRNMLLWLEQNDPSSLKRLLSKVSEVGRWDDLLIFQTDEIKALAFDLIKDALDSGNGLVAKWMPRKGEAAVELRTAFGWTPKYYRKRLVELTKVVETQMCAKNWSSINYSHVPSVASARYKKAFAKNDPTGYQAWVESLKNGTAKVNASAIFPHDVTKTLMHEISANVDVVQAQWDALPNYVQDGMTVLPMVDVSGSMTCGSIPGTTPLEVAVALGLYMSEKQRSAFKDMILTFSDSPTLMKVSGSIATRYRQLKRAEWGGRTNVHAAFGKILSHAVKNNVPASDMPEYILVLSDMEFDYCVRKPSATAHENAVEEYAKHGYKLPKVIFWNLNGREGNSPVEFKKDGTGLVSGFSPSTMRSIMSGKNITPLDIVMETLSSSRYDIP